MSLCFSILQALPPFYVHFYVYNICQNCKNPRVPGSEHRYHSWEDPGHRTIEQITPFLPWLVASARTSVWMLAPCVSNLLWGSIWFLVGVTDLSCTCSPVFPQLQSSSEREIRWWQPCSCLFISYIVICICSSQTPNLSLLPSLFGNPSLFSVSESPFLFFKQVHLYHVF